MDDDLFTSISRRALIQASATSLLAAGSATVVASALVGEAAAAPATVKVEEYILQRLSQSNVDKLFGVPGATCSAIFETAAAMAAMRLIVPSSDLVAGYAGDGYARVHGLGAVAATYGVGIMSMLPAIAGAYVERSPVVVINGGPSADDLTFQQSLGNLFSHSTGKPQSDLVMYREVTEYAVRIDKAQDVPSLVDKAIVTARTRQRPVYIEIAKHLWGANCPAPVGMLNFSVAPSGNETAIASDIIAKLRNAQKPALLLGIEVQRYGLASQVTALVNRLRIPWASTLLGKSVIAEQTPGFAGVYSGEDSPPSVEQVIERADALLAIGCIWGRTYRKLASDSQTRIALALNGNVKIGQAPPRTASLAALITALQAQPWTPNPAHMPNPPLPGLSFDQRRASITPRPAGPEPGMTYEEAMRIVSGLLDGTLVAVTDTSLSMYPAADLNVTGANGFICNGVWQSIGYSIGAAIGAGLAPQARRPLVICGDGGFQMTAQGLSTMVKEGLPAIVIVLDNSLYAIEQWHIAKSYFANSGTTPRSYLRLGQWKYADLAMAMGLGFARAATTPDEFRQALADAKANTAGPSFIVAKVKPHDLPSGLPTS